MGNKFFRPVNLSLFRTTRIGSKHLFDEDYKEDFQCELGGFLTHKAPLVEFYGCLCSFPLQAKAFCSFV